MVGTGVVLVFVVTAREGGKLAQLRTDKPSVQVETSFNCAFQSYVTGVLI